MNRLSRSHHPYTRPSRGSGADIGQITHRGITIFRRATSPTSSPQYFHLSSQYCGDVGTSVNAKVVTPEDFFFYPLRPFFPSFLLPSFSFSLFSTVKWPLKSSQEVWGALLDPFSGGENNICSHQTRFQGSKYISKRILVYLEPRLLQISSHSVIWNPTKLSKCGRSSMYCMLPCCRYFLHFITALHGMQSRSSDENSVCPSVCQLKTRALWHNGRTICPDCYTIRKII